MKVIVIFFLMAVSGSSFSSDNDDFDYGANAGNGGESSNYGVDDNFNYGID